ncbi:tryptophan-rich sensory protein [Patescibacteria group bacterium]|nr:tryptophan-rich sensory protein [Patescibacteria group bacterium]MCG2695228.1 tryptophan-rich sensory protein [Candidatus Parcubacteria bacterium]
MKTLKLFLSIIICELAGILGAIAISPALNNWYIDLQKPLWNPPAWVFGPVWTTLYALMGVAFYLIWIKKDKGMAIKKAVYIFAIQLILNSLWSIIFFGLHNIFLALIEILILSVFIIWTMIEFYKIDKRATYLLIPYILWVCVATVLTLNIWLLN